jgi:acyl-CoA thioesterase I
MEKTNIGRGRPPQRKQPVARSWTSDPRKLAIPAVLVVGLIVWLFWPSQFSKVKNLDSRGTSIIAFGDSLTAGYGAAPADAYPSVLAKKCGVEIMNAGVSGDTTDAALARIDQDVLSRHPRIVIVGLGGNDFLRGNPLSATESNLRTVIRRIQGAGAMVVLIGFRFPSLSANYESMYERIANEENCLLVPDVMDGILANPALKSDEIHPNGRGYALMAERVAEPLAKLIRKADEAR